MKKQLSLFACLAFAATAAMAQTETKTPVGQKRQAELTAWKKYTVKGERFSVSLPTAPAMTTYDTLILELRKTQRSRELGAYADGAVYSIRVYENIKGLSLEDFIREQAGSSTYNPTPATTTVTQSGVTGRQYSSPIPTQLHISQYFATEGRLYRFNATGNPSEADAVKQFFSSIVFGKKAEGIEIKEGEGLPFASPTCDQVVTGRDVDTKVKLVMKPEPRYTEAARQNQVVGTVVLKVIFACNGSVENIKAVKELPQGLTEQSIAAARKIKYIPAVKDGKFASMWMQLEYNFNLY